MVLEGLSVGEDGPRGAREPHRHELVLDRVMLEAARLLRFTTLTVGEIAFRAGYTDQLYFSRAFRRRYGAAPTDYRRAEPTTKDPA